MNIQRNNLEAHKVSFAGHNKALDKYGYEQHTFNYLYDSDKYDCEVELYKIDKDSAKNLIVKDADSATPSIVLPMENGSVTADVSELMQTDSPLGFAYRFKLTDKTPEKNVSYAFDNGTVYNIKDTENTDNKFNIVLSNRATINKNGPMQLIMPDEYYPGVESMDGRVNDALRTNALTSVRTHANKLGGKFAGIVKRLPQIEKEGVKRIVGTPFTKDTISSHLYWTENAYQVAPELGSEKDFKDLQVNLFKHGINWIADAALVNEGFGGIHLSELLRKGDDSISKNMFRAGEKISLGILPDKSEFSRVKFINAPFVLSEDGESLSKKNPSYNPAKPTYVQFYDSRLASEEQVKSDSPLRMSTYDIKNTDNMYDITKHDDAVYPFPIEVSPSALTRNVGRVMAENGKVDVGDADTIKKIVDFENFNVVNKSASGGLEVWDGNVDIAKLNFYRSPNDESRFNALPFEQRAQAVEDFDKGTLAVRDYALNSGRYWTKLASDTQLEFASSAVAKGAQSADEYMYVIKDQVQKGQLPASTLENVDKEIIENVLNDEYHSRILDDYDMRSPINPEYDEANDYVFDDYIMKKTMDVPLETLPFSTNLLGVLTSPYIAKKANTDDELAVSRYDLSKANNPNLPEKYSFVYAQAEELYKNKIVPLADRVLSEIPGVKDDDGHVSEYGKFVINEIAPDLTKYLFVKAIDPKATVKVDAKGNFDFSSVNPENMTMQSIGIPYDGKTSEEEAQIAVSVMNKGLEAISQNELNSLSGKISARFKNRSLNDFKVAEMIMDRTESGLGWRIDAAKDIASIDAVRSGAESMTSAWNKVTDFWKRYNETVLSENSHAYTTAEITDLADLFANENSVEYTSDADAEQKFEQETGIIAVANYNYLFSLIPDLFAPLRLEDFDDNNGWQAREEMNKNLLNKMDEGWGENPGFLFQSPKDGVTNSYTFVGNHDKQRILHALSLDMALYTSDFSSDEAKEAAAKVLNKDESSIDFDKVSSKAIAMGSRLDTAFDAVLPENSALKSEINKAVSEIASGSFKGKEFDAEAFGTRPLDIAIRSVMDQVEYNGVKIPNREDLEAKTLQNILTPAFDRYFSIYKLLTVLPGSPTDFAGDKVGVTGAESKAKNYHQQNRNIIPWEWLDGDSSNRYGFVKKQYETLNDIANLRNRPELSALNDGDTVTVPIMEKNAKTDEVERNLRLQGMIRYNDKGSVLLILTDSRGANAPLTEKMDRTNGQKITRLYLDPSITNAKQGLKHGMEVGTKFQNANSKDKAVYSIAKAKDGYYLAKRDKNGRELPISIKPEDLNTMILYKV